MSEGVFLEEIKFENDFGPFKKGTRIYFNDGMKNILEFYFKNKRGFSKIDAKSVAERMKINVIVGENGTGKSRLLYWVYKNKFKDFNILFDSFANPILLSGDVKTIYEKLNDYCFKIGLFLVLKNLINSETFKNSLKKWLYLNDDIDLILCPEKIDNCDDVNDLFEIVKLFLEVNFEWEDILEYVNYIIIKLVYNFLFYYEHEYFELSKEELRQIFNGLIEILKKRDSRNRLGELYYVLNYIGVLLLLVGINGLSIFFVDDWTIDERSKVDNLVMKDLENIKEMINYLDILEFESDESLNSIKSKFDRIVEYVSEVVKEIEIYITIDNGKEGINELLLYHSDKIFRIIEDLKKEVESKINKFLNRLKKNINFKNISNGKRNQIFSKYIEFLYKNRYNKLIKTICSCIETDIFIKNLSINLLSSGQQIMIYRFSILYKKIIDDKSNNKHFLILIDEPDLHLHLDWQRQYIQRLIDIFGEFLKENKDISLHFIIATHSPFILSDVPAENVILLQKGKDGYTKVTDWWGNKFNDEEKFKTFEKYKEYIAKQKYNNGTFGANFVDLIRNGFFFQTKNLMGSFAEGVIDGIAEERRQEITNKSQIEKEVIESIESKIGDSFLRDNLLYFKKSDAED